MLRAVAMENGPGQIELTVRIQPAGPCVTTRRIIQTQASLGTSGFSGAVLPSQIRHSSAACLFVGWANRQYCSFSVTRDPCCLSKSSAFQASSIITVRDAFSSRMSKLLDVVRIGRRNADRSTV
jgi:hypothetical protein